jgi:hypothetical protein
VFCFPRSPGRRALILAAATLLLIPNAIRASTPQYEQPPINYTQSQPTDPVGALAKAIEQGTIKLAHELKHGYLDALLHELKISPASQVLVFSRTSFQPAHISPRQPRALYFNDDTYVGFIPGAELIELVSIDPVLGATFYTLDQRPAPAKAGIVRQIDNCLQCHGESMTRGVPGLLVRSVFSDDEGYPILSAGTFLTTHASPLSERWGGWYVTGTTGNQPHMGNTLWSEQDGADPKPLPAPAGKAGLLPADVDASAYPSPHSDVVALMVLEHQVEAHNRIIRAVHGTLRALRDEKTLADALGETIKPDEHSDSTLGRIKSSCEPLVEYLLFADEAPLTDAVAGSSSFAAEFASRGPKDSRGRSLREFDLKTRLFRYPCSFLIHSDSINKLPEVAKQYVFARLREILDGKETGKTYAHLSAEDRVAINDILKETKPEIFTPTPPR